MDDELVIESRSAGYRRHAAVARDLARQCQSAGARAALLEMAQRYDRLAAFAERSAAVGPALPHPPAPAAAGMSLH